jgi:hypothetical protein
MHTLAVAVRRPIAGFSESARLFRSNACRISAEPAAVFASCMVFPAVPVFSDYTNWSV